MRNPNLILYCVHIISYSVYGVQGSSELYVNGNGLSASRESLSNPFLSNMTRHRSSRDISQKHHRHHHQNRKSCNKSSTSPGTSPPAEVRPITEKLVTEIIGEYSMRERSIGYHAPDFVLLVHHGFRLFQGAYQSWQSTPPPLKTFISNITEVLNELRLLSSTILRHLDSINKLGVSSGDIKLNLLKGVSKPRKRRNLHETYNDVTLHNSLRQKRSTSDNSSNEYWVPFEKAVSYLNATNSWYSFLQELSNVLGTYEMQKPSKYVDDDGQFSGWDGKGNITTRNLKDALERMFAEYSLSSLGGSLITLLVSTVNRARLYFVNEIIKATLLSSTVCSRTTNYIFVVGSYVSVSSIIKCVDSQIHHAVAVAANKVFIDVDLDSVSINKGSSFNVAIIAPYWEIVGGNRVMNTSAPTGNPNGRDGGEPGLPGRNGGNFYGVVHNVSSNNGSKLQIIANGGQGRPGHAGGYHPVRIGCQSPRKIAERECSFGCQAACTPNDPCECPECDYFCCTPTVHFIYDGRDGGQGGLGGSYGSVDVVSTTGVSLEGVIGVERNVGQNGPVGAGGKGKTTTTPPPQSELSGAGITQINSNKNNYCVRNSSEIASPNPSAEDGGDGKDLRPPEFPLLAKTDLHGIVLGARKFKAVVLSSSHIFSRPGIISIIHYLDNNSTIQAEYKTTDFLGEYFDLQDQSRNISTHLLPELFYNSVSKRSIKRLQNITGKDEMRLLSFMYSAALAKKLAISHAYQPHNRDDIYRVLRQELKILTDMMEISSGEDLHRLFRKSLEDLAEYRINFMYIFRQAVLFGEQFILRDVHVTEKYFHHVTMRLLKDIKNYTGNGNQGGLESARAKLLMHTILNSLFVVVKLAAISFSFWNPVGAAIVLGANLSSCLKGYGSAAMNRHQIEQQIELPYYVSEANSRGAYIIRKVTAYSFRGLVRELNAAYMFLSPFPEDFKEVLEEIKRINETASEMATEPSNNTEQFPPQDHVHAFKVLLTGSWFIKGAQKNLSSMLDLKRGGGKNKNQEDAARLAYGIFLIDSQFFNQIGSEKDDIVEVVEQILTAGNEFTVIAAHAERLQAEMIPDMNSMLGELSSLMSDRLSQTILTIRWRMQSVILGTKVYFEQTFPHKNEYDLLVDNALHMLDEATTSFVRFYEHLQDNHDQTVVFNFVNTAVQNKDTYFVNSTNSTIEEATQALRYNLLGQLLVKRHQRASGLFRYWEFPAVTADYCKSYENIISNGLVFSSKSDIMDFLRILIKVTEKMKTIRDRVPSNLRFGRMTLFTWSNATHWGRIKSLLQGETVNMFSDALGGPGLCEAIKINHFYMCFTSAAGNATLTKEMKEAMDHFYIDLIHQGNSYYRLGDKIKILHGNALNITFSFELKPNGAPELTNGLYKVLARGNHTLSPFAFYEMKIQDIANKGNFSILADKFKLFDMHLQGNGTCVNRNFNFGGHYSPDCSDYLSGEKVGNQRTFDYPDTVDLEDLLQELSQITLSKNYDFQHLFPKDE